MKFNIGDKIKVWFEDKIEPEGGLWLYGTIEEVTIYKKIHWRHGIIKDKTIVKKIINFENEPLNIENTLKSFMDLKIEKIK